MGTKTEEEEVMFVDALLNAQATDIGWHDPVLCQLQRFPGDQPCGHPHCQPAETRRIHEDCAECRTADNRPDPSYGLIPIGGLGMFCQGCQQCWTSRHPLNSLRIEEVD